MTISSRTPEGEPNQCPVCGNTLVLEPSRPPGDAPCPCCGTLLWFPAEPLAPVLTVWEYGEQLINRGDVVAGLEMLQAVVARDPGNVGPRRSLREIEKRLRGLSTWINEPVSIILQDVWCQIRQAQRKRAAPLVEWDTIDRAAERGLAMNPWDADLHMELGRACQARGFREAARFAYQCALESEPDRADALRALAELQRA